MLISKREAIALLRDAGVGARAADLALTCGLAGPVVRTRHALLHDDARVRALAGRRVLPGRLIHEACPRGLFVGRRGVDATRTWAEQRAALEVGWHDVEPWHLLRLQMDIRDLGPLPFLVCTGGFVTFAADIGRVGLDKRPGGRQLELHPPGEWSATFEGARLRTGPGRPWVVHAPLPVLGPRLPPARVRMGA